jgi:carbon monoxide dehydrogenase subunit G
MGGDMETFSNSVTIDRPVDEVFAFLSDFENVPTWNYAIAETRKSSPGPVAVGATYVQRRQMPKPTEERFTVTELAPGRRLAVEGTLGSFPAKPRYELERSGAGTVLVNTVELQMTGPLRFLGGIAASRVKAAVAENLDVLKRLLESRP